MSYYRNFPQYLRRFFLFLFLFFVQLQSEQSTIADKHAEWDVSDVFYLFQNLKPQDWWVSGAILRQTWLQGVHQRKANTLWLQNVNVDNPSWVCSPDRAIPRSFRKASGVPRTWCGWISSGRFDFWVPDRNKTSDSFYLTFWHLLSAYVTQPSGLSDWIKRT